MMKYYSINSHIFPNAAGIYFVGRIDRKILYIGATTSFSMRLSPHPKLNEFLRLNAHFYYLLFFKLRPKTEYKNGKGWVFDHVNYDIDKEVIFKYEKKYIRKYKPILNVQSKSRKQNIIIELDPVWLTPIIK